VNRLSTIAPGEQGPPGRVLPDAVTPAGAGREAGVVGLLLLAPEDEVPVGKGRPTAREVPVTDPGDAVPTALFDEDAAAL